MTNYEEFKSREELAANLIANAWADGIEMRTQDEYLDLRPLKDDAREIFVKKLTGRLTDKICAFEFFNHKNKDLSMMQICHYNETTSDEILATAAREAGIPLSHLPTYSYSKIFLTDDNVLMLDLNTSDVNKRDAYVIDEVYEGTKTTFDVKHYEPEAGINLPDYLANLDTKTM